MLQQLAQIQNQSLLPTSPNIAQRQIEIKVRILRIESAVVPTGSPDSGRNSLVHCRAKHRELRGKDMV